jgi:hypothetical protein
MAFTERGWVHTETGELYVTILDAKGQRRDDHCGTPVTVEDETP